MKTISKLNKIATVLAFTAFMHTGAAASQGGGDQLYWDWAARQTFCSEKISAG